MRTLCDSEVTAEVHEMLERRNGAHLAAIMHSYLCTLAQTTFYLSSDHQGEGVRDVARRVLWLRSTQSLR